MMQRQEPFLSGGMAVGELLSDDRPAPGRSRLLLPITVSVLAHGAALIWMINAEVRLPETAAPAAPVSIRISFVPELVPAEPAPESSMDEVSEPAEVDMAPVTSDASALAEMVQQPAQAQMQEPEQALAQEPVEEAVRPRLQAPSTAELRTAVNGAAAQQRERALLLDCDTLQQRHPLLDCAEQDSPDFSVLDASIVADYFARGVIEAPADTGEGFTDAQQTARALRMIDTVNRTHITRDRVMGRTP